MLPERPPARASQRDLCGLGLAVAVGVLPLTLACQPSQGETTLFTTTPPTSSELTSTGEGTSVGTTGATGSGGLGTSTTHTGDVSTSTTAASGEVSTTFLQDVGAETDFGDPKPAGCGGKIDFLFVMSRSTGMELIQTQLIAAFPQFIDTIESKFADFDYHIMVVDGDAHWGLVTCNDDCTPEGCPVPDYPCDLMDTLTTCDWTMGAGSIFPAGGLAANVPCKVAGDRRYLTKEQPKLEETFTCLASLGMSGRNQIGEAFAAAMQPPMNAPAGCNAGFLRDDALLMVTMIGGYDDFSAGEPSSWAAAALAAKHDDPDSIVMFRIGVVGCPDADRVCQLAKMFPHRLIIDAFIKDYGASFAEAADLVDEACADFIPQ